MASATDFEIDGTQFRLSPLQVKDQLACLGLVAPIVGALRGAKDGAGAHAAVGALASLPKLFDLFVSNCQASGAGCPETNKVTWTALEPFKEDVFRRNAPKLVAFVVECIGLELGSFLHGNGPNLIQTSVAKHFASRTG